MYFIDPHTKLNVVAYKKMHYILLWVLIDILLVVLLVYGIQYALIHLYPVHHMVYTVVEELDNN
jgi:hypothetical protein